MWYTSHKKQRQAVQKDHKDTNTHGNEINKLTKMKWKMATKHTRKYIQIKGSECK